MGALRGLVPPHVVHYDAQRVSVVERDDHELAVMSYTCARDGRRVRLRCRVVVAADGAHSTLRAHVARGGMRVVDDDDDDDVDDDDDNNNAGRALRYCGELCFRGVLRLSEVRGALEAAQVRAVLPDAPSLHVMRLCYATGLRCSHGYMSADGDVVYWWVKHLHDDSSGGDVEQLPLKWPSHLQTLYRLTPTHARYVQPIEDSTRLCMWTTPRVALVGDAAHVLSPNMGHGAALAMEDALVLATQLANNWHRRDGHLEAFYNYQFVRRPYIDAMRVETRRQLFVAQLTAAPAVALRNWLLARVPPSVLERKLRQSMFDLSDALADYDALSHLN
ncbi:unnamed protein product [Agarophyton chilense]